jgi:hypothetical protein
LNPIFNISPVDINAEETSLVGEVSNEGFSYFFLNDKNKTVNGLTVFHFEKKETENNVPVLLKKIFDEQPGLAGNYKNVYISYSFNESILTPNVYYNSAQNAENIDLVYGDLYNGIILADDVQEKNLFNVYRIPYDIYQAVAGHFPLAKVTHQYSVLVKQLQNQGDVMKIIFYQNKIVIALAKNDKLQIVQTFNYATAEDVVYHMLNICNEFGVEKVKVELCGMIEKDSALYKQIHKYFLMTSFAELPGALTYTESLKEFPSHFFSHLFSIALCV